MPVRDNNIRFGEFLRIIDGDTFQCRIQVLPHVRPRLEMVANIRVHNWNAAEMNTQEGRIMRRKFEQLLLSAKRIDLQVRGMSFERIVASVWLDDELFAGILTHELLSLRAAALEQAGGAEAGKGFEGPVRPVQERRPGHEEG